MWRCPRAVSTVLCVHERLCQPEDCNQHGTCVDGQCVCQPGWATPTCANLTCQPADCGDHGLCTPGEIMHVCMCLFLCVNEVKYLTYISVLYALELHWYASDKNNHRMFFVFYRHNCQKKLLKICLCCYDLLCCMI